MSEEERKIEKSDKIIKIVKKILKFNKQNQKGEGIPCQAQCLLDY